MLTKKSTQRHCILQLTAPIFQFQSSPPVNQAIITVDRHSFSQGTFVHDDSEQGSQVQINCSLSPFTQRPRYIFGALTKVWHVWFFFFTSASSASHSFLLVLISVSWGEKKAEGGCYGLSGTEASWENSVKLGRERESWSISLFSSI